MRITTGNWGGHGLSLPENRKPAIYRRSLKSRYSDGAEMPKGQIAAHRDGVWRQTDIKVAAANGFGMHISLRVAIHARSFGPLNVADNGGEEL